MKFSTIAGALLLGLYQSSYAEITEVNAHSLAAWTVAGGQPTFAGDHSGLTLPPAGRISRLFASNAVSVSLVTSPVFGTDAEDWPVIEIGSAALAFMRIGETGKAVLLVDRADPVILPYSFALDADGQSIDPLRLEFGLEGNAVMIIVNGQIFRMAANVAPALEVAISGGSRQPWLFDRLLIRIPDLPGVAATSPGNKTASEAATVQARIPNESTPSRVSPVSKPDAPTAGQDSEKTGSDANIQVVAPKALLGVFTPPSVRQRIAERLSEAAPKLSR